MTHSIPLLLILTAVAHATLLPSQHIRSAYASAYASDTDCPHVCRPGNEGRRLADSECQFSRRCSVQECVGETETPFEGVWCAQRVLIPPVGTGDGFAGAANRTDACRLAADGCAVSLRNQGIECLAFSYALWQDWCKIAIRNAYCHADASSVVVHNAVLALRQAYGFAHSFVDVQQHLAWQGVVVVALQFHEHFAHV